MSVNLLLRRRANMAANSSSSGGGDTPVGGEESDIIYLDINSEFLGTNGDIRVTITSESLVPYDLSIYFMGSNLADMVIPPKLDFYYGSTFNVDQSFNVATQTDDYLSADTILGVRKLDPIDLNYQIIPSYICAINSNELMLYLYATNIDKIPISPDDMGANAEICPIKMIFRVSPVMYNTTLDRVVWYNYNDEILFRDLYTGNIYALNSSGNFYQWN